MIMYASTQTIELNVALGVVRDKAGRVLISRRKNNTHQANLWELPGGKFAQAEDATGALNRELFEELNIKPKNSSPLIKINDSYANLKVRLHVREVHDFDGVPMAKENQPLKWVALHELNNYKFPVANKPILNAIKLGQQYAIVGGNNTQQIVLALENVAKQGVRLVQIRAKDLYKPDAEAILEAVRLKCSDLKLTYLLNSQMLVKRRLHEGVHLTALDLMNLNKRPKSSGFVAASCHHLEELNKAEQLALDFAVLSPIRQTATHPIAKPLGWHQFEQWVAQTNIPVFALGGMEKKHLDLAINYGAQGISGISLFRQTLNKTA